MVAHETTADALAGVTLLFVYNADSGVMNSLKDYVHKTVSPATYQCNLCALTFGSLGMKGTWAEFIDGLGVPVEFLHRDELHQRHGVEGVDLPAVLMKEGSDVSVLIPAEEINALGTLDELKGLVSLRVRELREERSSS
ncbi:MAG: hypothetical protein JSW25_08525 [Thermoplasmata archaeon]|nr:MAG: hypothetical protein JSW25_08525 [Thermoplasmata archaeon]